jgi:dienelactone hydrolase
MHGFCHPLSIVVCAIAGLSLGSCARNLDSLSPHFKTLKPDGEGPFPAVMMVSGCSGFDTPVGKPHYDSVQTRLRDMGFVVLRVDYLAARGRTTCDGGAVTVTDAARDVRAVATHLQSQPSVKNGSINALGWSYGGAIVLAALSDDTQTALDTVIAYYPSCRRIKAWNSGAPVLVLFGENDDVVSLDKCQQLFSKLTKPATADLRTYPDAFHAFDFRGLPAKKEYRFGTIGYNEAAAKAAWNEPRSFIKH